MPTSILLSGGVDDAINLLVAPGSSPSRSKCYAFSECTTKGEWQLIASQNIYNENPRTEQDIVDSTALRIYEIRCKIVHTKSTELDAQGDILLPFSKESQKLQFDIE